MSDKTTLGSSVESIKSDQKQQEEIVSENSTPNRPRCIATTNSAKKCKKKSVENSVYCSTHYRIFVKCEDVGQNTAIYFDLEGGPGLIKDVWNLIGEYLNLLDIRTLCLTCKTLFNLCTSPEWYANKAHVRYILLENHRDLPVPSKYQDEISCKIRKARQIRRYSAARYTITMLEENVNNFRHLSPVLYVVNSYTAARAVYRLLVTHGKIRAHKIKLDQSGSDIEDSICLYELYNIVLGMIKRIVDVFTNTNLTSMTIPAINLGSEDDTDAKINLVIASVRTKHPTAIYEIKDDMILFSRTLQ
jgi:hypothetical protein